MWLFPRPHDCTANRIYGKLGKLQLVVLWQLIPELLILFNTIVYSTFYELYITGLMMTKVGQNMMM